MDWKLPEDLKTYDFISIGTLKTWNKYKKVSNMSFSQFLKTFFEVVGDVSRGMRRKTPKSQKSTFRYI